MNFDAMVKQKIKSYYNVFLSKSKDKYVKESLIGFVIISLLAGGFAMNSWYKHRQSAKAFAGLMEVAKSYEAALALDRKQRLITDDKAKKENPWEDTQVLLDAANSNSSGSALAPFFLLYKAQLVLEEENDLEKSIDLTRQAISYFSKDSIYYDMFNFKRIKMSLDSKDINTQKSALIELITVSQNPKNYCFEEALYVLGVYYIHNNDSTKSIESWKRLVENQSKTALIESPWVKQAQEKLKALGIDDSTGK